VSDPESPALPGPAARPTALVRIDRWWRAPAPAERLALVRVVVGFYCLANFGARVPSLLRVAKLSPARFEPVGIASVLAEPLSPGLFTVLVILSLLGALAFTLGWRQRQLAPIFAVSLLFVGTYRNCWGHMSHADQLVVIHVIVLAATPSADTLSLDARAGRRCAGPPERYGWPLRLIMVTVAISYMLAGWAKVDNGGWAWVSGESMGNQIANDALRKLRIGAAHSPFARWAIARPGLFTLMSTATVAVELGAFMALMDRPKLRAAWVLSVWCMHLGIAASMAIVFPYPVSGAALVSFFPLERGLAWAQGRWPALCALSDGSHP